MFIQKSTVNTIQWDFQFMTNEYKWIIHYFDTITFMADQLTLEGKCAV